MARAVTRRGLLAALLAAGCSAGTGEPVEILDPSPAFSTVTATPTEIKGDGVATSTIRVVLRDMNGTFLQTGGDVVDVSVDLGILSPVTDHNDGSYSTTLRSGTTGLATIVTSVNGAQFTTTQPTVRFVP
jgi:hypothetical protein